MPADTALSFERLDEWTQSLPSYRWLSVWPYRIHGAGSDASASELLAVFLRSEAYAEPYVRLVNEPAHGPYPFGSITPADFREEPAGSVASNVLAAVMGEASWMSDPDPADEAVQIAIRQRLAHFDPGDSAFHLELDPHEDADRLHEAGWIIWEFNEWIVINADREILTVVVIGMD